MTQSTAVTRIPPLLSGGIMLTARCNNACRHCVYRCSPAQTSVMTQERLDATFAALAKERSLHGVHLAGGEATLEMDLLEYALASARRHRIRVDYLETNCGWCDSPERAREGFERLREAGLRAVLISASLFHLEFIPWRHTQYGMRAAEEAFGGGGVIVWTDDVWRRMQKLDPDRTYRLDASCAALGLDPACGDVWRLHNYLTPSGRAAEALADGVERASPEAFAGASCRSSLERTGHFHIAPDGRLWTGCAGLAMGDIDDLHPALTAERYPLIAALCEEGPLGLLSFAPKYEPDPAGYIGKCHFCMDVRKHLARTGRFVELASDSYYR